MNIFTWIFRNLSELVTAIVVFGLLAAFAPMSELFARTVFIQHSANSGIEGEYVQILEAAGYRRVASQEEAQFTARFYYEQSPTYCEGVPHVFVRARMTIQESTWVEPLDMSSTEPCARDVIAAHVQVSDAITNDREIYIDRLRSF